MAAKLPRFSTLPPELPHTPAPHPAATPAPQQGPRSFVTEKPDAIEGHNFNPQWRAQNSGEPGVVHTSRDIEPQVNGISDELRAKHDASVKKYPFLNLSDGEFVILNIQRHLIGLLIPVASSAGLIILMLTGLIAYPFLTSGAATTTAATATGGIAAPGFGFVALIILLGSVLVGIYGYIAVWVYLRNQLFLTNESVIQELQYSLFSHHEQTASLGSIEDVSYKKHGIWQTMFNYGSIRLSTEGEETTYRFYYVANPKEQTAILTNAVEAYKNGRPVTGPEELES